VGTVAAAGCQTFIVHARNAWLQGLSPKENRDIPPLRYAVVHQLKLDFPQLTIIVNGGITRTDQVQEQLAQVDGVMIGREAYHNPWWLSEWDTLFYAEPERVISRDSIEEQMVQFMEQQAQNGIGWYPIARHMLGLRHGLPGARKWRQVWSDHRLKNLPAREVAKIAQQSIVRAEADDLPVQEG
jgi:tRNA-dihydrouridine synthase A